MSHLLSLHFTPVNASLRHFVSISLVLICLSGASGHDTSHRIDSLVNALKHASSDAERIHICHELTGVSDAESGIRYSKQALGIAEKSGDSKQIMECLIHLGSRYSATSNYNDALATLNRAVDIGVVKKLQSLLSDTYLELGIVYLRQQNLDSARSILNKGLATAQKKGDERKLGLMYNVLGNVSKEENNFTEAYCYFPLQFTTLLCKWVRICLVSKNNKI